MMKFFSVLAVSGFFFAVLFGLTAGLLIDATCAMTGFLCSPNHGIFAFIQAFNKMSLPSAFALTASFYVMGALIMLLVQLNQRSVLSSLLSIFCFSNIRHLSPVYEIRTSWLANFINSPGF